MSDIHSKLPRTSTTIFTVMSALAAAHHAVNLSQGFPDYPVHPRLKTLVAEAIQADHNQYAPMAGVPALRQQIALKIARSYAWTPDPDAEITVTTGASQAICSAITMLIRPGDEVIVLEPAYDSYIPSILVNGGIPVVYEMRGPEFRVDWEAVEALVTPRTRLLVINNPHNPTGTTMGAEDLAAVERIITRHELLLLSDEVYEHLVYDGARHHSVLSSPALRARSMTAFSFGKTFHATGWKVGYLVAPPALTAEFRKVHQFTVFSVNTPVQHALAIFLQDPGHWQSLPAFFQQKRDLLQTGMQRTSFKALPSRGTYFQLYDYSAVSELPDLEFARWLTTTHGVATIPLSPFYSSGLDQRLVRICFAKRSETLEAALGRLSAI